MHIPCIYQHRSPSLSLYPSSSLTFGCARAGHRCLDIGVCTCAHVATDETCLVGRQAGRVGLFACLHTHIDIESREKSHISYLHTHTHSQCGLAAFRWLPLSWRILDWDASFCFLSCKVTCLLGKNHSDPSI